MVCNALQAVTSFLFVLFVLLPSYIVNLRLPKMAKIKKKIYRISGIVLLIVVAFIFTFNLVVAKIIEKKIDCFLADEHLNHYHIKYTGVGFNLLNRSVSLTGFRYFPDSSFLDSLDKSDINTIAPEVTVGRLTVSGIDFMAVMDGYHIVIRKITVIKPVIRLYKFNGRLRSTKEEKKKKLSLDDSVRLVGIKGISVGTFAFNESKFEIYNYKLRKYVLTSKDITITMHELTFKPSGHGNNYFYPALRDASFVAKDNVMKLGNNLYEIAFQQLAVNLKGESLTFKGFHFKPLYSKEAFSKHIKFQKERFDMRAGEIAFTGINFYRFLTENEIRIRKITISDAFIDLYRDKRVPFNHSQRPLLPNQSLKRMKGKLKIDTVQIKNTRFDYGEMMDSGSQPLNIYFTNLSGTITHISNFPYLWRKNSMKVTLKGRLMQKAPLDIRFVFPLSAKSDTFYFRGAVYGPVLLSVFNPAIYPAAGLKFDKGDLDKLSFSGSANPIYSSGAMKMLYHSMDLKAMKKKETQTTNKFLSWGVNSLVRKNNPRKGEGKEAKAVTMFFLRDVEKGFGNFFWKTLFSGMKATMLPSVNTINRKNRQSVSQTNSITVKSKSQTGKKKR